MELLTKDNEIERIERIGAFLLIFPYSAYYHKFDHNLIAILGFKSNTSVRMLRTYVPSCLDQI